MNENTVAEENQVEDTQMMEDDCFVVESIPQMVTLLEAWHSHKVEIVEHMLDVPEGTDAALDNGEVIVLEGAALTAFKIGITVALSELGTLPFSLEMARDDEAVH